MTRSFGVHAIGLLIYDSDLESHASANNQDSSEVGDECFTDFWGCDGTAIPIAQDRPSYDVTGDFIMVELQRKPYLFEAAYPSYEVALSELKEAASPFLPSDFNYEERFVELIGSIEG